MSATEQTIESSGGGGLTNPVCEIILQKNFIPNNLLPPINFIHTDNGLEIDIISAGVTEFFRDVSQGMYNIAVEGSYTSPTSPQNTEWNSVYTDAVNNGHGNIQNVTTRVYSDFYTALNSSIGNFVLTTPLVMHDLITDKYYLFTFTQWTQGGGGGGFQYTRTEVLIGAVICNGRVTFDDGTWIDTKPVSQGLYPTHAAKSPTTTYSAPISTGVNSVLIGLDLNDGGGSEVFALGTRLFLNGSPTLFGVIAIGFANTINSGNYQGIYFLGDGNFFSGGSSFGTIIGEQNSITGGTYSVIQGISNTHNSANSQVTIGFANSILNSSQSVVIGHSNGLSSLNSSVIIGRNNTSVISASSVNVLNANFGLKVLATFSGIGTIGFVPTARWHVKGIGNTSATTGLLVESSNTQNFFRVYDDGSIVSVGAANNAHSFSTYVGSVSLSFNSPVSQYLEFRVTGNIKSQLINQNGLTRFNQAVGQFWGVYGSDNNPYILFDETNKNVGFGLLAPTARVHIKGINVSPLNYTLKIENSVSNLYKISNNGEHTFNSYFNGGGSGVPNFLFQSNDSLLLKLTSSAGSIISWDEAIGNTGQFSNTGGYAQMLFKNRFTLKRYSDNVSKLWMDDANGYIGIGYVYFAANAQLDVYGDTTLTNYAFHIGGGVSADLFKVRNDGRISMNQLPTSNVGLVAGELWNNAGVVNIV